MMAHINDFPYMYFRVQMMARINDFRICIMARITVVCVRMIAQMRELFKPLLIWYSTNIFFMSFTIVALLLFVHTFLLSVKHYFKTNLVSERDLNAGTFFLVNNLSKRWFFALQMLVEVCDQFLQLLQKD